MDVKKKEALIITLFTLFVCLITISFDKYFLEKYLLSGDFFVWIVFISVIFIIGIFFYFGMLFMIKDIERSKELDSDEFFEMHKRRMKYFLIFSIIMLIIVLVIFDSMFKVNLVFTMILVIFYLMTILMLVFAWYKGAKKMAEEKSKEKIIFAPKQSPDFLQISFYCRPI